MKCCWGRLHNAYQRNAASASAQNVFLQDDFPAGALLTIDYGKKSYVTKGFVRLALERLDPGAMPPHLPELLPLVLNLVAEDWYKLIAEALRVAGAVAKALRPLPEAANANDAALDATGGGENDAMGEAGGFPVDPAVAPLVPQLWAACVPCSPPLDQSKPTGVLFETILRTATM